MTQVMMTHRQRVMTALAHEEPDRVPIDLGGTRVSSFHVAAHQKMKAHFGIEGEEVIIHRIMQTAQVDERILVALDIDTRCVILGGMEGAPDIELPDGKYQDEYGVIRQKPAGSHYYDLISSPLAGDITLSDIARFRWPDPLDPGLFRGLREKVRHLKEDTDYAVILAIPGGFVHTTQYLRGFEDWFMDLRANQKIAGALFDAAVEHHQATCVEALRQVGDMIDIVMCSDDVAHQRGPICHPDLYRSLIKPRQARLYKTVHSYTKAPMFYHTCGSVYKLLDDLIEVGVDILNPVQVAARDMDTARLKREFGDRLSFWGGIDTQWVLPQGTPADVRAEVDRRIADLAPGGGYVLNAVHNVQPDVPVENVLTMFQYAVERGRYPIRPS
ncbi:MAG: uroporphyrinogen decarboxylase family protein [Bacteroidetes bacterium]|nr:uroporphyrinogen decarboxylase family protein [Bacteroidota bacterium]MCL5026989.1 uroporphyrinogen decarboxylase family protein [Chloroflexota bacterium]